MLQLRALQLFALALAHMRRMSARTSKDDSSSFSMSEQKLSSIAILPHTTARLAHLLAAACVSLSFRRPAPLSSPRRRARVAPTNRDGLPVTADGNHGLLDVRRRRRRRRQRLGHDEQIMRERLARRFDVPGG